jgi:hypothetical protein
LRGLARQAILDQHADAGRNGDNDIPQELHDRRYHHAETRRVAPATEVLCVRAGVEKSLIGYSFCDNVLLSNIRRPL